MPSFNNDTLLQALHQDVSALLNETHTRFGTVSETMLLHQPAPGSWSVAQCLDHLNGYGHYYIPRLREAIVKGEQRQLKARPVFRSSWLGNYFTNLMKPEADGSLRGKMKTPKDHRPPPQPDAKAAIAEFVSQQEQLLELLTRARNVDIRRLKVPISLTRFIRLSAGDTFRFLIAHEQRHILQAVRALHVATGKSPAAVSAQSLSGNAR